MFRRSRIPFLLGLLAFFLAGIQGRAVAQCDRGTFVSIHVDSVVAGDTRSWIDPRLGPAVRGRLLPLFDYRSYQLIKTDTAEMPCGQAVAFNLPDGRILHVAPMAVRGDTIAVYLVLFSGTRTVMRTDLKLVKGGMLVLVGSENKQSANISTIAIEVHNRVPVYTAANPLPSPASQTSPGR